MAKIKNERQLTSARLRELLDYNPATGVFRWRIMLSPRGAVGSIAGMVHPEGYRRIGIDGTLYRASRLAWLFMLGEWPAKYIDHRNGIKDDDAWSNLREAEFEENCRNVAGWGASGVKGVTKRKDDGSYQASIWKERSIYLGRFSTLGEAAEARRLAALRLQGKFAYEARSEE